MADRDRLTDVPGVAVGHWSDPEARTGCTVVLLPENTIASCEVRGGAPASRELAMLEPARTVDKIDALLLTGGSAFGLAAADGVVGWLEDRGRGWPTPAGPVPIVPALGLFDLAVGDATIRPGAAQGRAACANATDEIHDIGPVGAGTGCTTGKWLGLDHVQPGGLVAASERLGDVVISVLVAVNAWGSVGRSSAGVAEALKSRPTAQLLGNTTIGAVVTNARLDKTQCLLLAQSAHDGLARAVFPTHARSDGDAFIAAATQQVEVSTDVQATHGAEVTIDDLRILTVAAVERAILGLSPDLLG
ncbi:MAG: P1 family peptidase [Microthrixaceae bacterium]